MGCRGGSEWGAAVGSKWGAGVISKYVTIERYTLASPECKRKYRKVIYELSVMYSNSN